MGTNNGRRPGTGKAKRPGPQSELVVNVAASLPGCLAVLVEAMGGACDISYSDLTATERLLFQATPGPTHIHLRTTLRPEMVGQVQVTEGPGGVPILEKAPVDLARVAPAGQPEPEGHVLEIGEQGWSMEHPRVCRQGSLLDCPLTKAAMALDGPPAEPGRYLVDLGPDDQLRIGNRVLLEDEPEGVEGWEAVEEGRTLPDEHEHEETGCWDQSHWDGNSPDPEG